MSKKPKAPPGTITATQTGWQDTAFICRKCARTLDGGFGEDGKQTLRQALRDALRRRGQRGRLGLIEVACLGICPKGAVTIGLASAPGHLLVVARHTQAEAILALARL
jgi:predicted metal-binding protein